MANSVIDERNRETPRLGPIELLRGLAALGVAWFHITQGSISPLVRFSGYEGRLGVPIFFVISGFVIPYSMWRANYKMGDFWRYIWRRLVRLEPSYIVSIGLAVALGARFTYPQLLSHLFYLIPFSHFNWINPVYWTLGYEFAFYISAGVMLPFLGQRHITWTAALGAVATVLIPVDHLFHGLIPCFVIGIAAARRYCDRDDNLTCAATIGAMLVLMIAVGGAAIAVAALLTVLAILFVRIPQSPWVAVLAALSYPLYLTHDFVAGVVARSITGPPIFIALASLTACILAAAAMHVVVERPSLFLSKKIRVGTPTAY